LSESHAAGASQAATQSFRQIDRRPRDAGPDEIAEIAGLDRQSISVAGFDQQTTVRPEQRQARAGISELHPEAVGGQVEKRQLQMAHRRADLAEDLGEQLQFEVKDL